MQLLWKCLVSELVAALTSLNATMWALRLVRSSTIYSRSNSSSEFLSLELIEHNKLGHNKPKNSRVNKVTNGGSSHSIVSNSQPTPV